MLLSMQEKLLSSALKIRDRKAAAALTDPFRRRILLMFIGNEYGVAELAHGTGIEIKRLHYHISALEKLGLLKVARSRPRAGRPIKIYRAAAPAFFVRAEIAPQPSSIPLSGLLNESLAAARAGREEGMLYHIDEGGEPRMKRIVSSDSRGVDAATEAWRVLALSQKDAQQLSREVAAVIEKYSDRTGASWLIHFAVAPADLPLVKGS
jgi:DNA-binding transcriptional ArsR family regulator